MSHTTPLELEFNDSLLERGSVVVAAVSGGADSMVLLELLAQLRVLLDLDLHVAHVNYGLRGEASQRDEALVRARCKALDVYLHVEQTDEIKPTTPNLEERARDVRHAFFKETAEEIGATAIVLGHTQDDQVETLLLRLLRGSGLLGLVGMQSSERSGEFTLLRPMLGLTRDAVRRYAHERGIPHREDASNRDLRFARNRVRHMLLPMLTKYFNPNVRETLTRSAELVTEDERFLDDLAATLYAKLVKERQTERGTESAISSDELIALPLALQRRIVRSMSRVAAPRERLGHSVALDNALRTLATHRDGVKFSLGAGLTLQRLQGTVRVTLA